MNTYNYLLSDFLVSDRPAVYGPDYYVDGKSLITPLSSTWLNTVSSISVINQSVSSLNLSYAPKLSVITIQEPDLIDYVPPVTKTSSLCAIFIKSTLLAISGGIMEYFVANLCPELRDISFNNIQEANVIIASYNPKLSGLFFPGDSLFNSQKRLQLMFMYNNLTNFSIDQLYNKIIQGTEFINASGLQDSRNYPNDSFVTVYDSNTGSDSSLVDLISSKNVQVNLIKVPEPPVSGSVVFATKI